MKNKYKVNFYINLGRSGTLNQNINPELVNSLPPLPVSNLMRSYNNPLNFDWIALNKSTIPKDQGNCGSCWAFGTAAFFESDLIINDGASLSLDLSEQFLISCQNRSFGCGGGYPFYAIEYVIQNGGIPL